MLKFIVRRLLLLVPILLGLSLLVFIWIRALPGGPAEALLGERATPESIAQIEDQYGLNKPIHVQTVRGVGYRLVTSGAEAATGAEAGEAKA
jgi:peptide/nickel transport system permease protein